MSQALHQYLRLEAFPTPYCSGCGHGILLSAIIRAIQSAELDIQKMLFASGIGCAAWIPSPHLKADTLHTLHGRPVAFATGAHLANKSLKVVVISGDGDLSAIGGNHLIHAARRNLPLTVICANNRIYGMTGGQAAPTTPAGCCSQTTPFGQEEAPFDLCRLVEGAGGKFVARRTVFHPRQLIATLSKALVCKDFSFVEVISPCPTHFGKMNEFPTLGSFMTDMKGKYIDRKRYDKLTPEERTNKIPCGEWIAS
ncbi:thiamine pyrophosphate-dependent enzyme [Calditrichota bacterium]